VTEPADRLYAIEYDPRAVKELGKFDQTIGRRVRTAIDGLAADPRPNGAKPLVGYAHFWRIRVGDYRIVYTIQDKRVTVLVVHIAHRREVYRGL
jgi:mRNA interferase RelE/StbE